MTVEREPEETNLVQTYIGVRPRALGKKRKKKVYTTPKTRQYEHVTRADPWAAASMVDFSKWILMSMPTSIMFLNWC